MDQTEGNGTFRLPDRRAAGRELASRLAAEHLRDPIVLALPRGGVPVAAEIAERLEAPFDVCIVRKVGAPSNPELAIGAVAEGGGCVNHAATMRAAGCSPAQFERQADAARAELERLAARLRGGQAPLEVGRRDVVLVDDGMATGSSAEVAVRALRRRGASRIVLAVPVSSREALGLIEPLVEQVVALHVPADLFAVGACYDDFSPVSSDQAAAMLRRG